VTAREQRRTRKVIVAAAPDRAGKSNLSKPTNNSRGVRGPAIAVVAACVLALAPLAAQAGAQVEERLAPSVVTVMSRAISDQPVPTDYAAKPELRAWLDAMSVRLAPRIPDLRTREEFLATVHYEATRAGLDPQLVLGVIHHESGFRKYAISIAGARGFMQVMPFWSRLIGSSEHNLFHLRTNLRYGCVILRHYLDIEEGDLYRALGRYNGSLGRPEYPTGVMTAVSRNWQFAPAVVKLPVTASLTVAR
jgi:soluble lytic murein transglycosylase-like protein